MPTCKTCRWWESPSDERDHQGKCLHAKVSNGLDLADGISDSYGDGKMLTGPDFGCVHHEEAK
jgi:hypothetical protein